jgi:chromate transporter
MGAPAVSALGTLAVHLMLLSLVAVGGVSAVLPELHRLAVDTHHWMTAAQFRDLFAIAQAAPGPNAMIVSLIGWQAAGLPGAVVAVAAMCGPSCVLTYFVARAWQRFRGAPWRRAVEQGMAPITVGLFLATGYLLISAPQAGPGAYLVAVATAALVLATRVSPLWFIAAAGGLGLVGLV